MCGVLPLMAIATTITAGATIQQGITQKQIGDFNAESARSGAQSVLKQGISAQEAQVARLAQIRGAQIAAMGASGVDTSKGTPGQVLDQTTELGELDKQMIGYNARLKAWGLENQARADEASGSMAKTAGGLNGFGTIIAGGARAWGLYQDDMKGKVQDPMTGQWGVDRRVR